ncbi:MAG TPA: hypothetical protein VNT54_11170 [Solirubrobacteraceae bacterium]|nr:hypothetical protein [Solirubrobacteraceae bacterium]
MTSPRVVELPRRLEPVAHDTFLAGCEPQAPRPVSYVANVVALRPRDAGGRRRAPTDPAAPAAA